MPGIALAPNEGIVVIEYGRLAGAGSGFADLFKTVLDALSRAGGDLLDAAFDNPMVSLPVLAVIMAVLLSRRRH